MSVTCVLPLLGILAAPVGAPTADTLLELRRGDRIVLENLEGDISVGTWERDMLEVRGLDDEVGLVVRRSGSTVRITHDDRKGPRRSTEAFVRVPAWIDLEARGSSLDLRVDGIGGHIVVSTVRGDVEVRGAAGPVEVRTVQGGIDISAAYGGVNASSQSDDVRLRDVAGAVTAHSGSGDLHLIDVRSASVRAETQDGDITFSGTVEDGGDYRFFVHDGDAVISVPSASNARVSVSTFDGDFESEFPVLIERFTGGREFDFTIGEPLARIEIQVFDGEIRLLRGR